MLDIEDLSADTVGELLTWPGGCQAAACVYWEHYEHRKNPVAQRVALKAEWFRRVTAEFGCCGKLARVDSVPVGFVQFAPPRYLPNALAYDCGPPSEDGVFVSCLHVAEEWRGRGVGRALLEAVLADVPRRGLAAVETYARKGPEAHNNPSGLLEFWARNGFRVVREGPEFALVRKELMEL